MKYLNKHAPPNPTLGYANSIDIPKRYTEIVSTGGGSTIDVGKWLARKYGLKHTAIPTTAGTGSEVTKYCVLMVNGEKHTFTDENFIPDEYKLKPKLVVSLPRIYTLSSGLDALSQALEAYWSKNQTDLSRIYSASAINAILEYLPISLKEPKNLEARHQMLLAANLSGRAINITKTNVCHAISYPLTEMYDIPHGIACAMSLKYFANKFLSLNLDRFFKEIDLPSYEIDIDEVANIAWRSAKLRDCPKITKKDIKKSL